MVSYSYQTYLSQQTNQSIQQNFSSTINVSEPYMYK